MVTTAPNKSQAPIGHAWLHRELGLSVPAPFTESYVVAGARRTQIDGPRTIEFYPRQYQTDNTPIAHLRFALRHEPTDLGTLVAALKAVDPAALEAWIKSEPTGAFSRRAWFFYETFTGRTLDVDDVRTGNYVEALDPNRHVVADRRNSARHRVVDNMLGEPSLALQLRFMASSDSMRGHDSRIVDVGDLDRGDAGAMGLVAAGGEGAHAAAVHAGAGGDLGRGVPGRAARA